MGERRYRGSHQRGHRGDRVSLMIEGPRRRSSYCHHYRGLLFHSLNTTLGIALDADVAGASRRVDSNSAHADLITFPADASASMVSTITTT